MPQLLIPIEARLHNRDSRIDHRSVSAHVGHSPFGILPAVEKIVPDATDQRKEAPQIECTSEAVRAPAEPAFRKNLLLRWGILQESYGFAKGLFLCIREQCGILAGILHPIGLCFFRSRYVTSFFER